MLARIRTRLGRAPAPGADERADVASQLAGRARGPLPACEGDLVDRFQERALALASTCESVTGPAAIPSAVARYLEAQRLPLRAVCWPALAALDWAGAGVAVEVRGAREDDLVGITGSYCAIAETGTLVMLSGADTPPTPSLLPETHIAVVPRDRVVAHMEEAWDLVRGAGALPRSVSFISGPSRTADIEQTVTLGAHGPYRVHLIISGA